MKDSEHEDSFSQRLINQLFSLSELSEALTLRLLESEKRLAALEDKKLSNEDNLNDKTSEVLQESEEKLMQLKKLINLKRDEYQDNQIDIYESNKIEFSNLKVVEEENHKPEQSLESDFKLSSEVN